MILVDTSVWIDYFKGKNNTRVLTQLLLENSVSTHPWVLGELMVGHLGSRRQDLLRDISLLPALKEYSIQELQQFVEKEELFGKGLSLIDCQLLYATLIDNCLLWTFDRQLNSMIAKYHLSYTP